MPDAAARPDTLSRGERTRLALQREIGRLLAVVWAPVAVAVMHFGFGWRILDRERVRRRYREVRAGSDAPLIVCANHLTMLDSAVIASALGSPGWYLRHYSSLPWNMPEWRNFGSSRTRRVLVYLMKCVPVIRGGDRRAVARVLARIRHLASRGEVVLIFPEGGRSRSGRVDVGNAAHGVGRLVGSLPGCQVLCVYARGEGQTETTDVPARGERFRLRLSLIEPTSDARGVRRSLDLSRQIVGELGRLEREVLREAA